MSKRLFRILFSISICGLLITVVLGQEATVYTHIHKSSKAIVRYKFVVRNDSTFIQGFVIERKSNLPVFNMNIAIPLDRIGTVPDLHGNFILFLPKLEGVLSFDKPSFDHFEFQYNSRSIR
jgi:hypothetical protein